MDIQKSFVVLQIIRSQQMNRVRSNEFVLQMSNWRDSGQCNDGSGKFQLSLLPPLAQLSPINDLLLEDIDRDGKIDCVLAQNFYGAQPEIGHHDAGVGLFLKGLGDGTFEANSLFVKLRHGQ